MLEGVPSRTALGVARRRAAHQLLDDHPLVLNDPLAVPILGPGAADRILANAEQDRQPFSLAMRAFVVARSRYAEDHLYQAVLKNVRQYVVLGAGLDTFAYRNPLSAEQLRVYEVDHPATQQWKRRLLASANIRVPRTLAFASVDFERQTLEEGLAAAGFCSEQPAFFSWLGVTPYLTLKAFRSTLRFIASRPPGTGVTFEYAMPRESLTFQGRLALDLIAARVEKAGEPFRLFFTPEQMRDELDDAGFSTVEGLSCREINVRYFQGRRDGLRLYGEAAKLTTAWV